MNHRTIDSPIGPLTLVVDADGVLTALYTHEQRHFPPEASLGRPDADAAAAAVEQLGEYFAGTRTDFDLALEPRGTEFQRAVWAVLREIPAGETWTYGQVAAQLGRPGAARAVGAAIGRNPVSIVVPCHRVVGSSGAMTGYAGGVERKRWLLDHERAVRSTAVAH